MGFLAVETSLRVEFFTAVFLPVVARWELPRASGDWSGWVDCSAGVGKVSSGKVMCSVVLRKKNFSLAGCGRWLVTTGFGCSVFGAVDAYDFISFVWGGEGAGVVAAEDAVADAGDDAVAEFAQGVGDEAEDLPDGRPGVVQKREDFIEGVGAAIEAFDGREGVGDEDYAFGAVLGVEASKKFLTERGFDGGKKECGIAVVAEEELHGSVAEDADAVVEEDRAASDLGAFRVGHVGSLWSSLLRLLYWRG
jgi:hypothetical protein